MRWDEVKQAYPSQWVMIEAINENLKEIKEL